MGAIIIRRPRSISSMMVLAVVVVAAVVVLTTNAFSPTINHHHLKQQPQTSTHPSSSTSLSIIGPLIRKMRGDNDAKNMPMANMEEARLEAPGLRVGAGAWKWPPIWPYDSNFFKRTSEMNAAQVKNALSNPMANLMGGAASSAGSSSSEGGEEGGSGDEKVDDGSVFDSLKYWDKNKNVRTELDERVAEKITK